MVRRRHRGGFRRSRKRTTSEMRCTQRRWWMLAPRIGVLLTAGVLGTTPAGAQSVARTPSAFGQASASVLPRPERVVIHDGAPFRIGTRLTIAVPADAPRLTETAELLARMLRSATGALVSVTAGQVASPSVPAITMGLDASLAARNTEAYRLSVRANGISLQGATPVSLVWASQTLVQLLQRELMFDAPPQWTIRAADVDDAPTFHWRGSMLDVGRHFLPVRDIERHIDLLSRYKMSVLHWHLTDDQGWRLEIARYPRLTSVGAWRTEADGSRYGGFYTRADVKHLVEYAHVRGITIVPEIEIPGHSSAALAAYPSLGCTNDTIAVPTTWGVFADVYCPGKESTFTFLFDVLDEVMELFPSPIIHIGGDEVPKDRWKACAECQAVMKREGLANEEELQSWFMQRIAAHVATRGRRVTGWDEVLDGPYVKDGLVQSWRDSSFTRKAALRGHLVIASPSDFTYLNRSAAELTLANVYGFNPMPPGLDSAARARVLGGEVPFWSEHITSGANLDMMALPRLLAFSEALWSGATSATTTALSAEARFAEFEARVNQTHLPALRAAGYAVGPADRALAVFGVQYDSIARQPKLRVTSLADGVVLRASADGSRPTGRSPLVRDGSVLRAPRLSRVQAFWKSEPVLEERRVTHEAHAGVGARVTTVPEVDSRYPGTGPFNLADGLIGSSNHSDGLWQGWWVPEVVMTAQLPGATRVGRVEIGFLQNVRSWIVLPGTVSFEWSADGRVWSAPVVVGHEVPASREGAFVRTFGATPTSRDALRWVRITARAVGPLPVGHPGAGQAAWIFADEIRVKIRR